jgi:hypothetical protein
MQDPELSILQVLFHLFFYNNYWSSLIISNITDEKTPIIWRSLFIYSNAHSKFSLWHLNSGLVNPIVFALIHFTNQVRAYGKDGLMGELR